MTEQPIPEDLEAVVRLHRTMHSLEQLLGEELLLEMSDRAREALAPDWHEDGRTDLDCICPAMEVLLRLYEGGFGVMPLDAIREAAPLVEAKRQREARARNN